MTDDSKPSQPTAKPATRPWSRGLRLPRSALLRIAITAAFLVLVVAMQRPCAHAVSVFVASFGDQGSAIPAQPSAPAAATAPGAAAPPVPDLKNAQHLRPGMTDDENRAAIERARRGSAAQLPAPN